HRLRLLDDQRVAGLDTVKTAEDDSIAGLCLAALGRLLAHQLEDSGDALVIGAAVHRSAVGKAAREHAGEGKLAAMRGVEGLEDMGARRRAINFKALGCGSDKRGFVPQRLQ